MKPNLKQLATLIIALLFFGIIYAPASLLVPTIKNISGKNLTIHSIHGTISQGSISTNHFESLKWELNFLDLIFLSLNADIDLKINDTNHLTANTNLSIFQNLSISDIDGTLTLYYLQKYLPKFTVPAQATIKITDTNADFEGQFLTLTDADGSLKVQKINLLGEQIGDYQVNFKMANKILNGTLKSTPKSAVATNLKINLNPKLTLTLKGTLTPKTPALKTIFKTLKITQKINYRTKLKK